MLCTRRSLLAGAVLIGGATKLSYGQDRDASLPDVATFERGDLIWPKLPGRAVPLYRSTAGGADAYSREQWEQEKQAFLESAENGSTSLSVQEVDEIRSLEFEDFVLRYYADRSGTAAPMSDAVPYVGHVGIIDFDESGQPVVIEAIMEGGIRVYPYTDWLMERPGEDVWHGRLADRGIEDRKGIADEAAKHAGRPYEFFNFDLNDDSGFYCSKLVWLSIYRSMEIAVDGTPDPRRSFWFSPKRLLNLESITKLHVPGDY